MLTLPRGAFSGRENVSLSSAEWARPSVASRHAYKGKGVLFVGPFGDFLISIFWICDLFLPELIEGDDFAAFLLFAFFAAFRGGWIVIIQCQRGKGFFFVIGKIVQRLKL